MATHPPPPNKKDFKKQKMLTLSVLYFLMWGQSFIFALLVIQVLI